MTQSLPGGVASQLTIAVGPEARLPPLLRTVLFAGKGKENFAMAIRFVILFASLCLVAERSGQLLMPGNSMPCATCDFGTAFHLTGIADPRTAFPLMRDYASMYHVAMIAAMATWGGELLRALSTLNVDLVKTRAFKDPTLAAIQQIVGQTNRRLEGRSTHVLLAVAAIGTAAVGLLNYRAGGIYSAFASEADSRFALIAASRWWASDNDWGGLAFLIIGGLGNYIIYWILYATLETCICVQRSSRHVTRRIDVGNQDGYWGWGSARHAVRVGSRTFIAASIGVAAVVLIGGIASAQYLMIFPLTLALGTAPFIYANRFYGTAAQNIGALDNVSDSLSRQLRVITLTLVPTRLISIRGITFQAAFTVVPGLLAIFDQVKNG